MILILKWNAFFSSSDNSYIFFVGFKITYLSGLSFLPSDIWNGIVKPYWINLTCEGLSKNNAEII